MAPLNGTPKAVFCTPDYIEAVKLAGSPPAALAGSPPAAMLLLAFGRADLAADQQGLTAEYTAQFMQAPRSAMI